MVQTWAQQQPLLLVIENAHWMDKASLWLTQSIARQAVSTAPILLLLVHRTEMEVDLAVLSELASPPQQVDVLLDAIPEDDVAEPRARAVRRSGHAAFAVGGPKELAQGNPFSS